MGPGYEARVADFRRGAEFLTLDYSDEIDDASRRPPPRPSPDGGGRTPVVYRGRAVRLDELKPQLLRDSETIKDAAGRFKGKVANLECPSCGASVAFSPGATTHLVCPACQATVDTSGPIAEVMEAARRGEAVKTSVPLGAKALLGGTTYTVIGLMRRLVVDDEDEWTEYLLYAPQRGFTWLVETEGGWERSDVLDAWPYWTGRGSGADRALLDGQPYDKLYDYRAVVRYAAGAFNWRVKAGDATEVTEFGRGDVKLAAEADAAELTWSRSRPLSGMARAACFGRDVDPRAVARADAGAKPVAPGGFKRAAKWLTILLIALNAIPALASSGLALVIALVAIAALWLPALFLESQAARRDG